MKIKIIIFLQFFLTIYNYCYAGDYQKITIHSVNPSELLEADSIYTKNNLKLINKKISKNNNRWTKTDTVLEIIYTGLHLIDYNQTIEIAKCEHVPTEVQEKINKFKNRNCYGKKYEENKFLGPHPSRGKINRYFLGTLIGHYFIARWLDKPNRTIWQSFWIYTEYNAITHNKRMGFTIRANF